MKRAIATGLVSLVVFALGCKENDPNQPDQAVVDAVLTHFGFDFSAGAADTVDYSMNDGETISWMPGNDTNPTYPSFDAYIWFRTSNNSSTNETKDMGAVALSSVTQVPGTWDTSPNIPPLLPGHVIVAACKDGYVKFQVVAADTSGLWPATVKYVFSATTSFPQ